MDNIKNQVIVDVVNVVIISVPLLWLYLFGQPNKRGFFCNDETIRYPYFEETFPASLFCVLVLSIPVMVICTTEVKKHGFRALSQFSFCNRRIPFWVMHAYGYCRIIVAGMLTLTLLSYAAKHYVGRLRPHFIDICRPDALEWCERNVTTEHHFITDYSCTSGATSYIREARLSFPSGHALLSFYTATFLIMVIRTGDDMTTLTLHGALFLCAMYPTLSRINDNMHHWQDVLAGSVLGVLAAFIIVARTKLTTLCSKKKTLQPDPETAYTAAQRDDTNI